MTIACPACRAENRERVCRRCRADLGMIWDLERQRDGLLGEAVRAFRRRDYARCIDRASEALALRNGPDAARLIACSHLMRRRFHRALERRQAISKLV